MSGNIAMQLTLFVTIFCVMVYPVASLLEPGIYKFTFTGNSDYMYYTMKNTKFAGSYFQIYLSGPCLKNVTDLKFKFGVFALKCGSYLPTENLLESSSENPEIKDHVVSDQMTFSCSQDKRVLVECPECQWLHSNITEEQRVNKTIVVPKDGVYVLQIQIDVSPGANVTADVESRANYGFLSAADWPQLPFYRIMFVVYFFYSLIWLILCCCHRSDLLRIQYWIGGVIFIGLIEKAVFLGEYETVNKTGQSVYGAIIFGELVSSAKKMLSRMLVIIVSVGFGIVKPRLGTTLHKVVAVGFVYFITSSIEGCMRVAKERVNQTQMMFLSGLALAVIDSGICWWIFSSLIQTMRTLRLRRNVVKLTLYRHFMNTLIFAVLASFGFMIWSNVEHHLVKCVEDWKELWVDEAFWHLLFAILLLVIMILWRPSANNQRYAYSPLTDAADDEAEEPMIHEAFDGIKLRGSKSQDGISPKVDAQMDDDLKWVDDNIPASIVDSALPSLLDSEEEIVTTAYERGKMQ